MATPPTRVTFVTPAVGYQSTASPKTTPTFDVVNGDLLVVIGHTADFNDTMSTPTSTGTVTWTLQQSVVVSAYCNLYCWTGAVTATATGITVSSTHTGSGTNVWSFGVSVWRNHGGVGTSTKTNVSSGAPSLAITCSANSAVVCGCDDWTATDGASRTWRTVNGAAMTESTYSTNVGVSYTVYASYTLDVGAAGSQTVGLTAPAAQKYSIVAVEVLGTGTAPAIPPILIMQTRRAY